MLMFAQFANFVTSRSLKLHDSNSWENQKKREVTNIRRYLGLYD